MNDTELAKDITVDSYKEFVSNKDMDSIAELVFKRFHERYIEPVQNNEIKHGFTIMAVSCLMIEALQSFKEGLEETNGQSKAIFKRFFNKCSHLKDFKNCSFKFYKQVRCGILHQAETTAGWRIIRKGKLFEQKTKTINATKFLSKLEKELEDYCENLRNSDWDSEIWESLRKKMEYICKNTEMISS